MIKDKAPDKIMHLGVEYIRFALYQDLYYVTIAEAEELLEQVRRIGKEDGILEHGVD